MPPGNSDANGHEGPPFDTPQSAIRLPAIALAAGLSFAAFASHAQAKPPVPLEDASIIIETNATDCDSGLQFFFDGGPWAEMTVGDPDGQTVLHVTAEGSLGGYGLTEQFNESHEPIMAELAAAANAVERGQCGKAEFTLVEFFELFPAGTYKFEGVTVEGATITGNAALSHVIPAPPELVAPAEEAEVDATAPLIIMWNLVDEPIATSPTIPEVGPVSIVAFHVVVERESPEPLVAFTVDLEVEPGVEAYQVTVPPEFLQAGASYKYEVLQIDESGNQTIAESPFSTAP